MSLLSVSETVLVWSGWLSVLVGLGLAVFGLRRRALPRPVCRRCGYPFERLDGLVGRVCNECGASIKSQKDLKNASRILSIGLIGLVIALTGLGFGVGANVKMWVMKLVTPRYKVEKTLQIKGATIRVLRPFWPYEFESRVEVEVGGRLAYQSDMLNPGAGGLNLDSDGSPVEAVWIRSDSGGSAGFSTTYVFSVDGGPGRSGLLPVAVLENGWFETTEADNRAIWIQPDLTYMYLWASRAGSPFPRVCAELSVSGGLAFLDPPPGSGPTPSELDAARAEIASLPIDEYARDRVVGLTLKPFFDLVYAGRANEGWEFLRSCFPVGIARVDADPRFASERRTLEAWEADLLARMHESASRELIERFNGGSIEPPP
jgi:uncharacterized protein (DUF983 family)